MSSVLAVGCGLWRLRLRSGARVGAARGAARAPERRPLRTVAGPAEVETEPLRLWHIGLESGDRSRSWAT